MQMQTPGRNTELDDAQTQAWSDYVSSTFADSVAAGARHGSDPWFVNAVDLPASPELPSKDIDWIAFPKRRPGQHAAVDADRQWQDEYCEWAVDGSGDHITAVTFTTETPDYYDFLNGSADAILLALYHRYVSPDVELADLRDGKRYNPANPWNDGTNVPGKILHMAQINNTFGAAASLSSVAAWPVVEADGSPVVSEQALIKCLKFGVASRHSDPHIGAQVNELVRSGSKVTLSDPVGLYIGRIMLSDVDTPDGSPITDWLEYDDDRGVDGFRTRVVFRAPPGSNFTVSDLQVDGEPVRAGGQLAEKIRVRIRGWAVATDEPALEPVVFRPGVEAAPPPALEGMPVRYGLARSRL